jgi:hypothetical protein
MIRSKRCHLLSVFALLALLLSAAGCGGSEDSTTSSGADLSAREETTDSSAATVPAKREGQAEKAESHNSDKADSDRGGKKAKAKSVKGKPAATDADHHGHSEQSDDVTKRVRELVGGDSGTQVVDSGRELKKVLREIKRSKQGQETPPVVEKILEEARGGRP